MMQRVTNSSKRLGRGRSNSSWLVCVFEIVRRLSGGFLEIPRLSHAHVQMSHICVSISERFRILWRNEEWRERMEDHHYYSLISINQYNAGVNQVGVYLLLSSLILVVTNWCPSWRHQIWVWPLRVELSSQSLSVLHHLSYHKPLSALSLPLLWARHRCLWSFFWARLCLLAGRALDWL